MPPWGEQELDVALRLHDKVSAECMALSRELAAKGMDAVNDARRLLCRHELERYKLFSLRYRVGDCSLMETLLSGPGERMLEVARVGSALDAMEVDFDDWGDELAGDASRAVANISAMLEELPHEHVAGLARGMELFILRFLDEAYAVHGAQDGSVKVMMEDFISGQQAIPGLSFARDVCRAASAP